MASRHRGRILALMGLYQIDLVAQDLEEVLKFKFYDKPVTEDEKEYARFLIKGVVDNWETIDKHIGNHSVHWELDRISTVNRSILRLSILSFMKEPLLPPQIIIDEALELTKEFESQDSIKFINGVLDSIRKTLVPN
ncbi:MAG: transcription antitermination factor NusB [Leptospira sp.]|nr:transcription antitermination factor NusB [Leptospira sp.]